MGHHRAARHDGPRPASDRATRRPLATRIARAARTSGRLPRLLRRIPAVPTIVGITALGIAGAGAVTVGDQTPADAFTLSSRGSAHHSGTDAIGFGGSERAQAISRDSERQAMQDAADAELQQAAEEQAAERNAELKSLGRAAEARAGEIAKNQWHLPTERLPPDRPLRHGRRSLVQQPHRPRHGRPAPAPPSWPSPTA